MKKRTVCAGLIGILALSFLVLGVLVVFYFDPLVDKLIYEELVLKNGTQTYEDWVHPPIVPYLKFYFFNVSNSYEFLNKGAKPILKELGPYTYREHWEKVNVSFNDNGTISYQTVKKYYFDRALSVGSEDDLIHTLNVPVAVAVDRVKYLGKFVKLALSSMFQVLNATAFITKSVNQLVWGYEDPLLELGNKFLPADKRVPYKKFGFFYQKNGTSGGVFNIFTGKDDIKRYTLIDNVNFKHSLDYWNSAECNMINGTDGTSYPPGVMKNTTLYLFNEDICRSLPLTYADDVERYGIKGYKFTPPEDVFAKVSEKKENECYCTEGPPCIGGGVFNISVCKYDSPSILSWPHFFQADEEFLNAVEGLNPDPEKHQLYIDVAPRTGFPLSALARLQINIATIRVPEIRAVANMTSMLFPVVWFEDGVEILPPKLISLLQKSSNLPEVMKSSLQLLFFIFGGLLLIACGIFFIRLHQQKTSNLVISKDKGHDNPMMYPEHST